MKHKRYEEMATDLDTLNELIEDAQEVWKIWLKSGFDWEKPLTINFEFYSANNPLSTKNLQLKFQTLA